MERPHAHLRKVEMRKVAFLLWASYPLRSRPLNVPIGKAGSKGNCTLPVELTGTAMIDPAPAYLRAW
jgi:hypothetical protein